MTPSNKSQEYVKSASPMSHSFLNPNFSSCTNLKAGDGDQNECQLWLCLAIEMHGNGIHVSKLKEDQRL